MYEFDFDTMIVGHEFEFYGVDNLQFKLGIDGFTFVLEAVEDPDDGYRSYLSCVQISEPDGIFFPTPVAKVRVEDFACKAQWSNRSGYRFVDLETGHEWLCFGTDHGDDYYPSFFFDYEPRKDQLVNLETSE